MFPSAESSKVISINLNSRNGNSVSYHLQRTYRSLTDTRHYASPLTYNGSFNLPSHPMMWFPFYR